MALGDRWGPVTRLSPKKFWKPFGHNGRSDGQKLGGRCKVGQLAVATISIKSIRKTPCRPRVLFSAGNTTDLPRGAMSRGPLTQRSPSSLHMLREFHYGGISAEKWQGQLSFLSLLFNLHTPKYNPLTLPFSWPTRMGQENQNHQFVKY